LRAFLCGVEIARMSGCKFAHFVGENLHMLWAGATLNCHVKEAESPTK
jgi:hypothetical protein